MPYSQPLSAEVSNVSSCPSDRRRLRRESAPTACEATQLLSGNSQGDPEPRPISYHAAVWEDAMCGLRLPFRACLPVVSLSGSRPLGIHGELLSSSGRWNMVDTLLAVALVVCGPPYFFSTDHCFIQRRPTHCIMKPNCEDPGTRFRRLPLSTYTGVPRHHKVHLRHVCTSFPASLL